jgi:hypothetical protein
VSHKCVFEFLIKLLDFTDEDWGCRHEHRFHAARSFQVISTDLQSDLLNALFLELLYFLQHDEHDFLAEQS